MPKKKPIPKTPKEVSQEQITSYLGTKPNSSDALVRGDQTSRNDDDVKDFSVGLQDIDESIIFYFNNIIKPNVVQAGENIKVPIIYGSPERWKAVQQDGFYRDKNQKILVPLIMFRRDSLEKNRNVGNKLDGNEANLYQVIEKKYTQRNQYDNFSVLNNRIPQREFYATVIPDYVTLSYNCVVWTNYIEQMNPIIEAINFASDSYWGDKNRFKFRARIDNFSTVTELNQGQDRGVKSTFNIIMNGYIIPNTINKYMAVKPSKFFSKCQVIINFETTNESLETFNAVTNKQNNDGSVIGIDSYNVNSTIVQNLTVSGSLNTDVITYLNTNTQKAATSSTSNTAVFPSGFLTAPNGMPATSIANFTFFVNGQLIEPAALVSFVDNGNTTSTLTVNTSELGFNFESNDEIIAIGKFSS